MILVDEAALDEFRGVRCEWCGRPWSEAAHIFGKLQGWARIDHPWNLCALCHECHMNQHDGNPPRVADLLWLASKREGVSVDGIEQFVWELRQETKEARRGDGAHLLRRRPAGHPPHHGRTGERPGEGDALRHDATRPPPVGGLRSLEVEPGPEYDL